MIVSWGNSNQGAAVCDFLSKFRVIIYLLCDVMLFEIVSFEFRSSLSSLLLMLFSFAVLFVSVSVSYNRKLSMRIVKIFVVSYIELFEWISLG